MTSLAKGHAGAAASSRGIQAPLVLTALTGVALVAALYFIFEVAPVERQMGIAQKIFYFHVPSASVMYLGYVLCGIASFMFLRTRSEKWDAVAVAGSEVGTLFCLMVLSTGPLWARKAWGVYWTWDPRLTTTLLAVLIHTAYLVLRSSSERGEVERRFAAGLALIALPNLLIIHYSVKLWRGTHPTVLTGRGQGIAPSMQPGLVCGFLLMFCVVALLLWLRVRAELARQRLEGLRMRATELGVGLDE